MPVGVRATSRGASLLVIGREMAGMDHAKVTGIFKDALQAAAPPFVAAVIRSALAIPVKPDGKRTGLRERIALCAESASWTDGRSASAVVEINPWHMFPNPPYYGTLPLYMEGAKPKWARWRHPVFGNRENWVTQDSHPFFYQAAAGFGPAAGVALEAALGDVTRQISG